MKKLRRIQEKVHVATVTTEVCHVCLFSYHCGFVAEACAYLVVIVGLWLRHVWTCSVIW